MVISEIFIYVPGWDEMTQPTKNNNNNNNIYSGVLREEIFVIYQILVSHFSIITHDVLYDNIHKLIEIPNNIHIYFKLILLGIK